MPMLPLTNLSPATFSLLCRTLPPDLSEACCGVSYGGGLAGTAMPLTLLQSSRTLAEKGNTAPPGQAFSADPLRGPALPQSQAA